MRIDVAMMPDRQTGDGRIPPERGKLAEKWLAGILWVLWYVACPGASAVGCVALVCSAQHKMVVPPRSPDDAGLAAAICPVVYPLDQYPSEKGYHYLFYGNAFFINEEGYALSAAHLMQAFKDGGQPHVLVGLPTGERRVLKAELVATDWEHDVAVLRVTPNPFQGEYHVRFLPLATERPAQGKAVVSVSLRPSSLEDAYTFDAPLEDRSRGEILGYQYTRGEKGHEIELLLYSQKVMPGQSGSPVILEESGEAVGFIEGRWLHPTNIPFVTTEEQVDPSPGAAVRIHYGIALLQQHGIPWHVTMESAGARENPLESTKGFSPPTPLSLVAAAYPPQALFGGEILLDAKVDPRGRITDVKVVQGQSPFLEEVLGAVQTWTFLSARLDGKAVEARIGIAVQFPQPYLPKLMARTHEYKAIERSSKDSAALPVYMVEPDYPPTSIGEGSVILHEIVDREGRVTSMRVLSDVQSLTPATVGAVRQWQFMPGRRGGENVESGIITVVTFRRPALASRGLHPDKGSSSCGVSIRGRCLFRQSK